MNYCQTQNGDYGLLEVFDDLIPIFSNHRGLNQYFEQQKSFCLLVIMPLLQFILFYLFLLVSYSIQLIQEGLKVGSVNCKVGVTCVPYLRTHMLTSFQSCFNTVLDCTSFKVLNI